MAMYSTFGGKTYMYIMLKVKANKYIGKPNNIAIHFKRGETFKEMGCGKREQKPNQNTV